MAEAGRYVVVAKGRKKAIVGGPYVWDGATKWQPPEEGRLMLEADALGKGYTYPAPDATG